MRVKQTLVSSGRSFPTRSKSSTPGFDPPSIILYVTGNLARNIKWQALAEESPLESEGLIARILEMANGVFLWVTLVVASLVKGINQRDDISDLSKRLELLPIGLEIFIAIC